MTIKRPALATGITLAVIAAVFLIAPQFYGNRSLLLSMLTFIALAQGLNLLYGFTGYLPFGYVGFFGAGAYATSLLVLHTGIPILGCVVLGGSTAVVFAVILGPLLRLNGAYFSIANLAASQILVQRGFQSRSLEHHRWPVWAQDRQSLQSARGVSSRCSSSS